MKKKIKTGSKKTSQEDVKLNTPEEKLKSKEESSKDWDGKWKRYSGGTAVRKRCTNMVTHVLSSSNHSAKTGAKPEGAEKTETQLVCSPALLRPHVFEKGSVFTNCVNRYLPCKYNASLWHQ